MIIEINYSKLKVRSTKKTSEKTIWNVTAKMIMNEYFQKYSIRKLSDKVDEKKNAKRTNL